MTRTEQARRGLALALYAHPFELAVLVFLVLSPLRKNLGPAAIADALDSPIVIAWDAITLAGVASAVAGIVIASSDPGQRARVILGRGAEKAGLWLLAAAQVATIITVAVEVRAATAVPHVIELAAIAAACALRVAAIRKTERIERHPTAGAHL